MTPDPQLLVRQAVAAALADLPPQETVVVACSGGPDSVALARAAAVLDRPVVAVVIDHALQPRSAEVAASAARLCEELGIEPVRVMRVEVSTGPGSGGLESAARDARRAALLQVANELNAPVILLGHTLDDQAETVLLRLARGSGAKSLSGMAVINGPWRRPLLALRRSTVHASVDDLATWTDPHNVDEAYARVRVRRTALPALIDALGEGVVPALARTADLLRDDAEALAVWAQRADTLDVSELQQLPRAVRTRILRNHAIDAGCPAGDLTAAHIARVDVLITDWHGQGAVDLPGGIAAERSCGRLCFVRAAPVAQRRRTRGEFT